MNTEFTAIYDTKTLPGVPSVKKEGDFVIKQVRFDKMQNKYVFLAGSTFDGSTYRIYDEAIIKIDGMSISRLGSIYRLAEDGTPLKPLKRRGRKPKNQANAEMYENTEEYDEDDEDEFEMEEAA